MTLGISFYDRIRYTHQDFINRDLDFIGNGVVRLTDFPLTFPTTPNMTLQVGQGVAWIDGYRAWNDSNLFSLTVAAADPTNPRIDIIQIGHDDINSLPSLVVKKGVAAASPIEPGADPNYLKLYAISVPANTTSISSSNITDRRGLVPLNVSGTQISMAGAASNGTNTFTGTQTAPEFVATSQTAPIQLPNLTSLPTPVPAAGVICVVNGQWYQSNGTTWVAMAPQINTATSNTAGTVEVVETPASGVPVTLTRVSSFQETLINGTTAQQVLTYTPQANHNFELNLYFRVITATTTVTIQVSYTDAGGNEVYYLLNGQSCTPGQYSCVPFTFNAKTTGSITVSVTAGTASQVYVSGALKAV